MQIRTAALLLAMLLCGTAFAVPGPKHKTLRAQAMGNAFTAVADDKDAIYYNPAGLWLINRLGNYEKEPELGYYPNNYIDMRMNFGFNGPVSEAYDIAQLAQDFKRVYDRGIDGGGDNNQNTLLDTLANHGELSDELNTYDRKPVNIGTKFDAEMAFHGWGGSIWVDGGISPYVDGGIITPSIGIDTFYVDAVAQTALAFAVTDKVWIGVGYMMAKREMFQEDHEISVLEWEETSDDVVDEADRARDDLFDVTSIGHAMNLGVQYQWKREVRLGAAVSNIFFTKLAGQTIRPDVSVGIAASPRKLQRNTAFSRKVNFAADFEDMLDHDRNYKFFSHLNFGMEIEQTLLALPWVDTQGARALQGRLGVGFKGGYLSAGGALEILRFISIEGATWAEEAGYYTGQEEDRYWAGQLSIGI